MTEESTIAELMARDPLKLTREDRRRVIQKFRDAAALFKLGDTKAGTTKKGSKNSLLNKIDPTELKGLQL